ncbi:MAG: hypothetical protein ACRENC_17510, partial [Gemmatimonadaceae bacterium]
GEGRGFREKLEAFDTAGLRAVINATSDFLNSRSGTRTRDPGIMSSSPPPAQEGSPSRDEA